jgi:uncharacterized OsmC-like protein
MDIFARVTSTKGCHATFVRTGEREQSLAIAAKEEGYGSSVNGGELLFLALATCYCNDVYREARKRGIEVSGVEVEVIGEFGGNGEPARNIRYRTTVMSSAPHAEVHDLIRHTDGVAEIHNTLRSGARIELVDFDVRRPDEDASLRSS